MTPTFKMAALALACALPLAPAFAADPAPATQSAGLSRLLAAELSRFPSKSGFYVKNLATGEEASVDPDAHFDSASTIKVAVMILAYRLADQKKLDLDERHEIGADDLRGGSGILRFHDLGLKPTLRDLITQMTITSDNVATDIMIARVGGVGAVNDFLKREGYAASGSTRPCSTISAACSPRSIRNTDRSPCRTPSRWTAMRPSSHPRGSRF